MKSKSKILIANDDDDFLRLISQSRTSGQLNIIPANTGESALEIFKKEVIDVVIIDRNLPCKTGMNILREIRSIDPQAVIVMISGYIDIRNAAEAIRDGALYFIKKPSDPDEISTVLDNAISARNLMNEIQHLRIQVRGTFSSNVFVGRSDAVKNIVTMIKNIAPTDSAVLIHGESGTGKELIARIIHQESRRSEKKFIAVNCGAVAESLLESTLFGFQKGAFTGAIKSTKGCFEEAEGGTIFLDEISETSPKFQTSLLRVLQEREFARIGDSTRVKADFRLITATNRDLQEEVRKGNFREDLYYRINVIPVHISPLRERREDIPVIAKQLLENINVSMGTRVSGFSPEALAILERAELKGNVRELQNIIERAVAIKHSGEITPLDLPEHLWKALGDEKPLGDPILHPFKKAKELFEEKYIKELLKMTGGNMSYAADISGIKRQNLYSKIKRYGLKQVLLLTFLYNCERLFSF